MTGAEHTSCSRHRSRASCQSVRTRNSRVPVLKGTAAPGASVQA